MGMGFAQGSLCNPNKINVTMIYNGEIRNPRLDIYNSWHALPGDLEKFTCPKKFMEKEMEKVPIIATFVP